MPMGRQFQFRRIKKSLFIHVFDLMGNAARICFCHKISKMVTKFGTKTIETTPCG
jgi:hypothetical protein